MGNRLAAERRTLPYGGQRGIGSRRSDEPYPMAGNGEIGSRRSDEPYLLNIK